MALLWTASIGEAVAQIQGLRAEPMGAESQVLREVNL